MELVSNIREEGNLHGDEIFLLFHSLHYSRGLYRSIPKKKSFGF